MTEEQRLTWPQVSSSAARPPMSMAIWPRSSESNISALSSALGGIYVNLQAATELVPLAQPHSGTEAVRRLLTAAQEDSFRVRTLFMQWFPDSLMTEKPLTPERLPCAG